VIMLIAALLVGASVHGTLSSRPAVAPLRYASSTLFHLRGGALDVKDMLAAAKDPEAMAEMQAMMSDPAALAEMREMMDDPEFRAQVMDALAAGGEGLSELKDILDTTGSSLKEGLQALGPGLGHALDALKQETPADAFDVACGALTNIARRRRKDPAARGKTGLRLRASNEQLCEALLQYGDRGQKCLRALGFTEEVTEGSETFFEIGDDVNLDEGQLDRALAVIDQARQDANQALALATAHELPYILALEIPNIRRACQGDQELGRKVTSLLLEHEEFRSTVCGPSAEIAVPSIAQLLRSRHGLQALVEFYTGEAPTSGTRVVTVGTLNEWKDALVNAGDKLVVALFSLNTDVGCRILSPMYLRLPEANDGEFADNIFFVRVEVDGRQDDGLALQIFDELGIPHTPVPAFAFLHECLELHRWRYQGADLGKLIGRIRKLAPDPSDPILRNDGPEDE